MKVKLILALLLALLLFIAYQSIQWQSHWIPLGPTAEVMQDRFYALKQMLDEQHIEHHSLSSHSEAAEWPEPSATVILLEIPAAGISDSLSEQLLAWVDRGGTLLISGYPESEDAELEVSQLHRAFGLAQASSSADQGGWTWPQLAIHNEEFYGYCDEQWISLDYHQANTRPLHIAFPSGARFVLSDIAAPDRITSDINEAIAIAEFSYGDGSVRFIPDAMLWHNEAVGCGDHALLLNQWLQSANSLWWLTIEPSSQFWLQALQVVPATATLLVLLLLLLLWHLLRQRKPRYSSQVEQAPQWLAHLTALANYHWKQGQRQRLIDAVRDEINQHWQRHAQHHSRSTEQQLAAMAEQLQLPSSELYAAMTASAPKSPHAFMQMIQTLQQIRNQL